MRLSRRSGATMSLARRGVIKIYVAQNIADGKCHTKIDRSVHQAIVQLKSKWLTSSSNSRSLTKLCSVLMTSKMISCRVRSLLDAAASTLAGTELAQTFS